jgi:hypothetical protein
MDVEYQQPQKELSLLDERQLEVLPERIFLLWRIMHEAEVLWMENSC